MPEDLHLMRERYMMPLWGRFLSRDPMGFAAGSTNLYTYAGNSPTNFTDRLGLEVLGGIDISVVSGADGGSTKRRGRRMVQPSAVCDDAFCAPRPRFVFPQVQGTLDKLRRQRGTKSGPQLFFERPTPPELRQRRDKQPREGMTMEQYGYLMSGSLQNLTATGAFLVGFGGAAIGSFYGPAGTGVGYVVGYGVGAVLGGLAALNSAQQGALGHAP